MYMLVAGRIAKLVEGDVEAGECDGGEPPKGSFGARGGL